jgi:hypothetical protein
MAHAPKRLARRHLRASRALRISALLRRRRGIGEEAAPPSRKIRTSKTRAAVDVEGDGVVDRLAGIGDAGRGLEAA